MMRLAAGGENEEALTKITQFGKAMVGVLLVPFLAYK